MNSRISYGWIPFTLVLTFGFVLAGCGFNAEDSTNNKTMTVYSSPSCSCCDRYVDYLRNQGMDVESVKLSNRELSGLKMEHGIPRRAQSCHTGLIGDYFVEGHVPVKAIATLTEEQPDLAGISIPGMKKNTPGMGYPAGKTFRVLSVDDRGRTGEFTRVTY